MPAKIRRETDDEICRRLDLWDAYNAVPGTLVEMVDPVDALPHRYELIEQFVAVKWGEGLCER